MRPTHIPRALLALFLVLFINLRVQSQLVLHTSGNKIMDSTGKQVILRGVNLGGWLVTENWMCGITDTTDAEGRASIQSLEKRFTKPQVKQLVKTWEDNWITAADLDTIQSLGFNFVRVPFGWRNLQDQKQQWYLDSLGHIDFSRFDWIVTQAAMRHIYVLLDYHIWLNQNQDYSGISHVDSVIRNACKIWKAVAGHFYGNTTVAGYDLLNEPTASYRDTVMHLIYDTVRSVDPSHMISIEWTAIDTGRWHNVLYQNHWYGLTSSSKSRNVTYFDSAYLPVLNNADSKGVPYYIGETHVADDSSMAWSLYQYCLHNTSWSPWTYKTINQWGWGLISLFPNKVSANIVKDPYDTILAKWSGVSKSNTSYELQDVKTIWRTGAKDVCLTNGIPEIKGQDLIVNLHPNPANTNVVLETNEAMIGGTVILSDITGREIMRSEIKTSETILSVSGCVNGIYFVKVSKPNEQSIVRKLLVVRY